MGRKRRDSLELGGSDRVSDFETAVRNNIPTLTVVLNNNFMATETHAMHESHERYGTMNILGNYADLAKSLGGWSERVEDPN